MRDKRHLEFQILMRESIAFRKFDSWSMGYSQHPVLANDEGINEGDHPKVVLEFLIAEADRQRSKLSKSERAFHSELKMSA